MRAKLYYSFLVLLVGSLYFTACDTTSHNTESFSDSIELYAGLEAVPNASNTTFKINKGKDLSKDSYFQVEISNLGNNDLIKPGIHGAWCIEWKKSLRSNNDEHKGVRLYSTNGNSKWKPLTYFFAIKQDLAKEDPSLTYLEFQSVVWSLAGYIGVAPEFDLDKLSNNELPSDLLENGEPIVNKEKVRQIVRKVKSEYASYYKYKALSSDDDLIIGETDGDEQDVVIDPEIARIELTPDPLSLGISETRTMTATVFDGENNEIEDAELVWSIDDESIATVDQNGNVTGVSEGSTTVTVQSGDISASATVIVNRVVDSVGNEFIIGMLPNFDATNTVEIHLTSDVSTSVTVDYPINSPTFTTTVSLTPGDITIVEIPNTSSQNWTPGTVQDNAIRATSDQDFVMYAVNRRPFSTDAALNLPVSVLGEEYMVSSYTPSFASVFSIVAAFDNTVVNITPTNNLQGGFTANTTFSITLNSGEGFLGYSTNTGASGDLTGTQINASQPVSVTNGNRCTNVPPGTAACDHMFQVAHPLFSWTTETIAAPLPNRPGGSIYRVLAREDGTTVQINGTGVSLNRGEFFETSIVSGAQVITADRPIFATQYMTGQNASGAISGDPAMGSLIPTDQFLSAYTFSTVGGGQFAEHYLNVVAHNDDVAGGTILLDGISIPAGEFTAIAGTNYSYAQITLAEGTHTTSSSSQPHGIYVIGFNSFDSYIYPGGAGIGDLGAL